jgi:signal transduction histidine kinase
VLGGAAKIRAEHMAEMMKVRAERARARAEQERRQASEERLRIARELHDVLGHHLSLINVQAGVGLHLMDNHPEQAREALSAIKTASRRGVARGPRGAGRAAAGGGGGAPASSARPRSPRRADRGRRAAGHRAHGRTAAAAAAEVDRAAYRIVQEALTNVRRHAAPGAPAQVAIEYTQAAVRLSVRNDGPPGKRHQGLAEPDTSPGSGIAGMRARAETLGGTLQAGLTPDGGFEVVATLPAAAANPAAGMEAAGTEAAATEAAGVEPAAAMEAAGAEPAAATEPAAVPAPEPVPETA